MKEPIEQIPNNKQENWITYRESAEFKIGLKELENSKGILSCSKVIVLAVALNIKKAGLIDFDKFLESYEQIEDMLSNLGVFFTRDEAREHWNLKHNGDPYVGFFIIGSTPETIGEAMKNSKPFEGQENWDKNFGEAMDFPSSSIEAFVSKDKSLLPSEDEKDKLTDEEKAFLFFKLSKDNWQVEIQWLEQIISAIKVYSPKIYNEVIDNYYIRQKQNK